VWPRAVPYAGAYANPWGDPYAAWAPPPQRTGLTPVARVLAGIVALLLVVGVGAVLRRTDLDGFTAAGSTGPGSREEAPRDVSVAIVKAKAFIEEFRGMPFTEEVEVTLLDGKAFENALLGGDDEDPDADAAEDGEDFEATLHGLQLADEDDDLDEEEAELLSDSVTGFYDDESEEMVVKATRLDALSELTLVHELTHAWQDQHYDLTALWDEVETNDEELALRSLIEGDANRTESAYRDKQSRAFQREADRLEEERYGGEDDGEGDYSRVQVSLSALYGFPYDVGEDFVNAVYDNGSNQSLDRAFQSPPVSTAQVLHPEKYVREDAPRAVATPAAGGKVVDKGTLGEARLIIAVARGDIDRKAIDAAEGWDGDAYVTWTAKGHTCTTVSVVMDTAKQRDRLVKLLRSRPLGPGGSVEARGPSAALFVSCVPYLT
jgi:hypothetical protein